MLTDYTTMTPERARKVVDDAIETGDALIAAAIAVEGHRTYENTMKPLDDATIVLGDAFGVGSYMARVHPDDDVRAAGAACEEKQQKWSADLAFNRELYDAVRAYADTDEAAALDGERRRNLEFWLRDFRLAGQELDADARSELRDLRGRLIELQVEAGRNIDDWEDGMDMTRDQLDGLPDAYIGRLTAGEAPDTFHVSVAYPDYIPFIEQATNRDLRRQMQFKFLNRAADENTPLLNQAVEVRWAIARLLGYSSFAEMAMEPKMADTVAVDEFYSSLVPGLTELGQREHAALTEIAGDEIDQLEPWDWSYLDSVQRRLDFGVDNNEVATYFPLDAVVDGMFEICAEVFDLSFVEVEDPKAWHEDVHVYEIRDRQTQDIVAHYYADLHPRPGKFSHAACWRLRLGYEGPDGYRRPVSAVAANFTKPTEDTPSLLQHSEAVTLFHEFGHVLHNTLTEVAIPRFSGAQTERDFVEAPSQIMENWMWEPEVLRRFARHHETGEPIPDELLASMIASRDQNVALKTLRQVFYGMFDLEMHGGDGPTDSDTAHDRHVHLTLLPPHEGTHFGASFGHMMSDGYTAGYYGYLWSKVYGDDMFSIFSDEGVLNPEVGVRYRKAILALGGTKDGMDLLRGFLGREPSSDAFLHKIGLAG